MVSQSSVECSWYEAYPLQRRSNMWVTKHMTSRRGGISAPTICRGLPVLWVTGHSSCPGARATCWPRSSLIALCHRSRWRQLSEIPACRLTARPAEPARRRSIASSQPTLSVLPSADRQRCCHDPPPEPAIGHRRRPDTSACGPSNRLTSGRHQNRLTSDFGSCVGVVPRTAPSFDLALSRGQPG